MKDRAPLKLTLPALRRWWNSELQRVSEWQLTPAYWKLRSKIINADFRLANWTFRIRQYLRSRHESVTAHRALLGGVFKPLALAAVIIFLLEFSEYLALRYGGSIAQLIHAPEWIRQWTSMLRRVVNRNVDYYATFLAAFAQIAGAFLALYFTAVSVVVSTVYARVQGDVRSIVLQDKVSNAYVALVAMLGAASTILLAALALGYLPGVASLIFVGVLGIASFYSFVELGWRMFHFFDPTRLVGYLTSDLARWVRSATLKGHRWLDESFQAHYQKQAEGVLTTYRNIVLLANREEHLQSDALVGLARRAFSLLSFYGKEKSAIPSDSWWFRRTHRHKMWLTTSFTETLTALNTGTSLRPDTVPDLMWFESEIEETVAYTLDKLLSRKDLQSVFAFSDAAQSALYYLSANFAVDEALHLFRTLAPPLRAQAHSAGSTGTETEDDLLKLNFALGLTDIHALGFIQILLGLANRLDKLTVGSMSQKVAEVKWQRPESIYQTGLPRSVIEQMEVLRKHLEFEHRVEGSLVTPVWYQQQVVAIAFIRFIERTCNELLSEFEKSMADEAESLVKERRSIFAAQLIERGLEGCNKFAYHFNALEKYAEALNKLRKIEDRPCPTIDWDSHARRVVKVRERLLTALARATLDLARLPKTNKLPDYFGHAYAYISDECYRTLAAGDTARFGRLFPLFFHAGLIARDQLMEASLTHDAMTNFGYSVQPIIDVVDISGFAYLYAELNEKDFREAVNKVWDAYLDAAPDKDEAARFICLNVSHKGSLFGMFPRDHIRAAWEQDFENRLRHLGLLEMPLYNFGFDEESKPKHSSKIINEIGVGIMLDYKPHHVFLAEYFMKRFDHTKLELPDKAKELYRAVNEDKSEPDADASADQE